MEVPHLASTCLDKIYSQELVVGKLREPQKTMRKQAGSDVSGLKLLGYFVVHEGRDAKADYWGRHSD